MTQIRKALISMGVFLVIAAGLGAWSWFGVHEGEKKEEARRDAESRAFAFEKADVARVVVNPLAATVEIEREGDGWRIVSPVATPADASAVKAIVDLLHDLRSTEVIAEDQSNLEEYGLDHPPLSVRIVLKNGTEHELQVGDENPFDKSLPFVRSGDSRVFSTASRLAAPLDKKLFDLRDKSLVTFGNDDVTRVEVTTPGSRWSAERSDDGWTVTLPGAGKGGADVVDRGDKSAIEGVLSRIRLARALDFPTEDSDDVALRAHGLDRPTATIALTVGDPGEGGSSTRSTLVFGEADGATFARVLEGGPVMEVESDLVQALGKTRDELRDRSLAVFEKERVRRFEIAPAEGEPIVVHRRKEKKEGVSWETEVFAFEGRSEKPKTWRLSSALHTLSTLKAASVVEDGAPSLATYGLDEPRFSYAVFDGDGVELARVLIGKPSGESRYFAARAGSTTVFEVEKSHVDELPTELADVVDEAKPVAEAEATAGGVEPDSEDP